MIERDWYSIEEQNGVKFVHYHGFAVPYWKDGLWSFIDLTWCYFPLSEVLEAEDREEVFRFNAEQVKQYQCEVSEAEAESIAESYCDKSSVTFLPLRYLAYDIPIGSYWF